MAVTLDKNTLKSNAPFALIELEIPGGTGPLPSPPAEPGKTLWGVNRGAAQDNFPLHGLQVYISNWSRMETGDSVSVLLDGTAQVARETIESGEVDQRVATFVPAARLTPGQHTLHYSVTRFGQKAETSEETAILVKLDRPGGQDQNGDIPGHSELTFSLPAEIERGGVDADAAKKGVPITIDVYPNMAEHDDIKVSWGGQFVYHRVKEEEVGNSIVITVDEETILTAGDSGLNGLAVTFEVYDIVQNRSEDWAAETRVVVDAGNSRLEAPIVQEARRGVIDLDKLGDADVIVQIWVMQGTQTLEELTAAFGEEKISQTMLSMGKDAVGWPQSLKADFNLGDKIVVQLTGTTAEGEAVSYEAPEVVVDDIPSIPAIPVPNLVVRQLAQTQVVFSYRVIREDGSEAKSKGAFISVIGEPIRLAAPEAIDASQGAIDPTLNSTSVKVPWDDSMAEGDVITLKWIGTRPDTSIYDPLLDAKVISHGDAQRKQDFMLTVAGEHLRAIEGGTLELHYLLERDVDDNTIVKRESAKASVLRVGAPRAELPAPTVPEVEDGALDPSSRGARLIVPNYRNKEVGDVIHCLWEGSKSGKYTDSITVRSATKTQPIIFDIPASEIASNNGGTVTTSYHVIRTPDGNRSDSDLFSFIVGEAVTYDPPVITSIKDTWNIEVQADGDTVDRKVTLSGTAHPDREVEIYNGATLVDTVTTGENGTWTFAYGGLTLATYSVKAKAKYGSGAESGVRGFRVTVGLTPMITAIKGPDGLEIPADTSTDHDRVTVEGTATPHRTLDLYLNDAVSVRFNNTPSGAWTRQITNLTPGVKTLYCRKGYADTGSGPKRSFTVNLSVAPTITSIKDSTSTEIPPGSPTFDTSATVTGTAPASQAVEVFNGASSLGKQTANTSGVWTLPLTGLTAGAYDIKAVGQYGSNPPSAVRSFSVVAVTAVAITAVKDSKGTSIPNGGTTTDTTVTVEGTVTYS